MRRCADAIMPDDLRDMGEREREIRVVELNRGVARADEMVRHKGLNKREANLSGEVSRKLDGAMVGEYP